MPRVVIRQVRYRFRELSEWRDLLTAKILPHSGVVFVDLDEAKNRVEIGVEVVGKLGEIEAKVAELGVPLEAIRFTVASPVSEETGHSLRDRARPMLGGLQVSTDSTVCTLGLNAIWEQVPPSSVFVTASHCTFVRLASDGAVFYQPLPEAGNRIGREVHDPPSFRCGPFWDRDDCRYADVAIILHETSNFEQGFIAQTLNRVGPGRGLRGSVETNGQRLQIISESPTSLVGEVVEKIGRTTGWTYGEITDTCVHTKGPGDFKFLCQDFATYSSEGHDSGAPVFIWHGDNTVTLRGIHRGSDTVQNLAVFAPLANVERDLGPLLATVAVAVEIQGPSAVDHPGTYAWEAFPAGGNGSYSYHWSVYYFNTGTTDVLGTAKTQTLDVWRELGHFEMRITVSSAGVAGSDTHFVNNNIDQGPGDPEFRRRPRLRP
ncbi:hypothetical protein HRbin33_01504 [bacterium HR33]|nr:hypothetical protein HRbin33_01504 [bacterium HR33]